MTDRLDLPTRYRDQVEALLREHVPEAEVWAYGSRVNGMSHDASDLDLVLRSPDLTPIPTLQLTDLAEAFQLSNIPILVEARDWARLPESFHQEIERDYVAVREADLASEKWPMVRLDEVIEVNPKRTLSSGTEAPFISMADVKEHCRSLATKQTRHYKGSGSRFRNGDTLLARITPCLENGKTIWITDLSEETTGHGSTEFIVLSARKGATDPLFVYYLARSPTFRAYAIEQMTGTSGRQRVPTQSVKNYKFTLPRLEDQRRIAQILGTFDDKIELNRRMCETLEGIARALFKSWFVDFDPVRAKMEGRWRPGESLPGLPAELYDLFPDRLVDSELGPLPQGWQVTTLGQLCGKPQYGYTQSATKEPIGPKFLRITDLNKEAWIDWGSVPYCKISPEAYAKYRVSVGDLLIARMADPGHGCMIDDKVDAVFASYLIRFRPLQRRLGRFLQYWIRSDEYWTLVNERKTGTTRSSLNAKVLSSLPLAKPDNLVFDAFSDHIDKLRHSVVNISKMSHTLISIREALLPRLLSGELRC